MPKPYYLQAFADLSRREFFVLLPFAIAVLAMGVMPDVLLDTVRLSVATLLQR